MDSKKQNTPPQEGTDLPKIVNISFRNVDVSSERQQQLWNAIRVHTELIAFQEFADFVDAALCKGNGAPTVLGRGLNLGQLAHDCKGNAKKPTFEGYIPGVDLYSFLKVAAEVFLLLRCGICEPPASYRHDDHVDQTGGGRGDGTFDSGNGPNDPKPDELIRKLITFLGSDRYSYVDAIVRNVYSDGRLGESPFCGTSVNRGPCFLELIWSYWHEEAMLVQTTTAIALRFQNVARGARDPLTEFELSPLRPLSGFIWGYIQDESNRLSVARRALEYQHEYGLGLVGRATAGMRPADSRSKFLQAFHDLLRMADQFYREAADNTITPDPFPLLIALRDLHMIMAEGAHNQFRDLPWTARCEMLVQQWLLSRPETRDFLRGRIMVPYPEEWMGTVDAMKRLQGWPDTNTIHFADLARFGERLLLSVRHVRWDIIAAPLAAQDWALEWRPEIQGYIHAYRIATGVMLSDDVVDINRPDSPRYMQPSSLLRARFARERRDRGLPPAQPQRRLSLPNRSRSIAEK